MRSSAWLALAAAVVLAAVAASGLPRLTVDGTRAFALPEGHPLPELNDRVDAATGGDDLFAVVVVDASGDAHGLLDADGVALIERIRAGMEELPAFDGVRAVTSAALLADVDGAVSAIRPLQPPPAHEAGWTAARQAVLADPFARDLLISADGRTALVAGWLFRGTPEQALVRRATLALRDAEFRATDAGAAVQEAINGARLAVALGEAPGPADAEIGRRLTALAGQGPAAEEVGAWREEAAGEPVARALAAVGPLLDGLEPPPGHRVGLAGVAAVEAALTRIVPAGIRLGLLGLVVVAGLVGWRGRGAWSDAALAAVAPAFAFGVALGLFGLFGVPLHPLSALVALLGAAWAAGLAAARSHGRPVAPGGALVCAALVAVPAGIGLSEASAQAAPALVLGVATLVGLLAPVGDGAKTGREESSAPHWWITQLALLLAVAGLAGSWGLVAGVDAARLLAPSHPAGRATVDLAESLGAAPPAFAVYLDDDRPRALAEPVALSGLRLVQDSLEVDEAVVGSRSWADFVAALHAEVSGASGGTLPEERALVDQYLLMFGDEQQTRTLASADLSLGLAWLKLGPGGGAHLGRLAERWPADGRPVALAGDGVQVSLAGRIAALRMLLLGGCGLLVGLALVVVAAFGRGLGARRAVTDGLAVLAGGLAALAVGGQLLGAAAPAVCVAALGALALAVLSALVPRRPAMALLLVAGLGVAPLLPSQALELRAFAAALAAGCLALLLVRAGYTDSDGRS